MQWRTRPAATAWSASFALGRGPGGLRPVRLGLWMVGLDYYSLVPHRPDIHKGVGILPFAAMPLRLLWRAISSPLPALDSWSSAATGRGAALAHGPLHVGPFVLMLSGHLLTHRRWPTDRRVRLVRGAGAVRRLARRGRHRRCRAPLAGLGTDGLAAPHGAAALGATISYRPRRDLKRMLGRDA